MRQHQPGNPNLQAVQLGLRRAHSTFRKQRSPRQRTTFLSNCVYSLAGRERGGHTDTEPISAQYRGQSRSPRSRQSSPLSANKQQSCRNHASAQQTSATSNRAQQNWKNNNKFALLSDRNQQDDAASLLTNQSCRLKVIRFRFQMPQTFRPTPHIGKNPLLGTGSNDTCVPKIRQLRPEATRRGQCTPRSVKLGPPTKTDRAAMPGGHQLARFLKKGSQSLFPGT